MGISNVSNGVRWGVCTSSTRPSAPYEGMMIYETDTNRVLVWDNAAWVMIADTDQPPGLQLTASASFTTASSVQVDNCFSSDFANYRVVVDGTGTQTSPATVNLRMVNGTTPDSGSLYGTSAVYSTAGATPTAFWTGIIAQAYVGAAADVSMRIAFDIFAPNAAANTTFASVNTCFGSAALYNSVQHGLVISTTTYGGLYLWPDAGTITGTIRVYGYRN